MVTCIPISSGCIPAFTSESCMFDATLPFYPSRGSRMFKASFTIIYHHLPSWPPRWMVDICRYHGFQSLPPMASFGPNHLPSKPSRFGRCQTAPPRTWLDSDEVQIITRTKSSTARKHCATQQIAEASWRTGAKSCVFLLGDIWIYSIIQHLNEIPTWRYLDTKSLHIKSHLIWSNPIWRYLEH